MYQYPQGRTYLNTEVVKEREEAGSYMGCFDQRQCYFAVVRR